MVKSAARMRLASTGAEDFLGKINDVLAPLSAPTMFATLASVRHCGGGQLEPATRESQPTACDLIPAPKSSSKAR